MEFFKMVNRFKKNRQSTQTLRYGLHDHGLVVWFSQKPKHLFASPKRPAR